MRMMREKETNKFRGGLHHLFSLLGMAFVDIPEGSVCKAMELHHTYLNGKMINVEETKNGGKHSAVVACREYQVVEEEGLHQPHAEAPQ